MLLIFGVARMIAAEIRREPLVEGDARYGIRDTRCGIPDARYGCEIRDAGWETGTLYILYIRVLAWGTSRKIPAE
jgi:hypothetical protein